MSNPSDFIIENGVLTRYVGPGGDVEIPEGVTRIGGHAFHSCHRLEEAVIPYTVNEIGSSAFRQCERLESIDLPAGCEVNERAFKNSPTQINWY
jgi:hypothetical protein